MTGPAVEAGGSGTSVRVPGFLPSTNGFRFANSFADQPAVTVDLGIATIHVGNAADGLCGGMVFAALDYWTRGSPPPQDASPPRSGAPLFHYLVRRLVDSWNLPGGPLTYLKLMSPLLHEGDRRIGPVPVHGRAWRVATQEWPRVRGDVEAGRPCPLGLVKVRSVNPLDLGKNHQVLCYGFDQVATAVRLWVYDPNQPGVDHVSIALDVAHPGSPVPVAMEPNASDPPDVLCFFRVPYAPKTPPS